MSFTQWCMPIVDLLTLQDCEWAVHVYLSHIETFRTVNEQLQVPYCSMRSSCGVRKWYWISYLVLSSACWMWLLLSKVMTCMFQMQVGQLREVCNKNHTAKLSCFLTLRVGWYWCAFNLSLTKVINGLYQ